MRVLLTGFEPFAAESENASGAVVGRLAAAWSDGSVELHTAVLPVGFEAGPAALAAAIRRSRPDLVLCLGEAGGRQELTPERWAGAVADARIPDNLGAQPRGELLDAGPPRLPSGLDVEAMVGAIRAAGVPAAPSDDAGGFVCNAVFRALLREAGVPGGFLHVPAVRSHGVAATGAETDSPALPPAPPAGGRLTADDLQRGVAAAVLALRPTRA